jgi:hypothetical protein
MREGTMKNEVVFGLLFVVILGAFGYFFLLKEEPQPNETDRVSEKSVASDEVPTIPPPPPPAPHPPVKNETGEPFPREAGVRQRRAPVMEAPVTPPARPTPAPKLLPPPSPKKRARKPNPASTVFVSDRATPPEVILRGEVIPPEKLDEVMVWGTDADSLQGSIMEQHEEFVRCYDAWLEVEPELAGMLKIGLTIGQATEQDSLASVTALDVVDSDLDHSVFEGCIIGALQDLTYEQTDGDIVVNYPMRFHREEEE